MEIEEKELNESTLQSVQWALGCPGRDRGLSLRAGRHQLSADKPWRSFPLPFSPCGSPARPQCETDALCHIGAHSMARDQPLGDTPSL